jgi:hypothetical protein
MKDRKKSDRVGHSGPRTSPMPCQTRSAPTIPSHPTTAIARIPVTSAVIVTGIVVERRTERDHVDLPCSNIGGASPRRRRVSGGCFTTFH